MEDLNTLHWKVLKKMVEAKGGAYTSKNDAITFLSSPAEEATSSEAALAGDVLDKQRPHGQVLGDVEGYPTARYSQGGSLFDAHGNKLG